MGLLEGLEGVREEVGGVSQTVLVVCWWVSKRASKASERRDAGVNRGGVVASLLISLFTAPHISPWVSFWLMIKIVHLIFCFPINFFYICGSIKYFLIMLGDKNMARATRRKSLVMGCNILYATNITDAVDAESIIAGNDIDLFLERCSQGYPTKLLYTESGSNGRTMYYNTVADTFYYRGVLGSNFTVYFGMFNLYTTDGTGSALVKLTINTVGTGTPPAGWVVDKSGKYWVRVV